MNAMLCILCTQCFGKDLPWLHLCSYIRLPKAKPKALVMQEHDKAFFAQ